MIVLKHILAIIIGNLVVNNEASRILTVVPTPSISHQVVFRPLIMELVERGHEVVLITTDPVFKNGGAPGNLTEIDVHDISYEIWKELLTATVTSGKKDEQKSQSIGIALAMAKVFEKQMLVDEVQKILKDDSQKFDLLILEAHFTTLLGLSHRFKAPVIQISSMGAFEENLKIVGAASNLFLYPTCFQQRVYNLNKWEKLQELFSYFYMNKVFETINNMSNEHLPQIFGLDTPPIEKLKNNVEMLFLNIHSVWERNRPVPPNVIFMGGIHQKPEKELPQDLKTYLDSSKHGVIYISFGTNVDPALLPPENIQAILNAVAKLPYDVLWKWNQDELPGKTPNIKISKWLPQSDLLRHPKVKLFITQGGLQSTDEAITAGVPLIGIPMLADQWLNVEQYVHHKIGIKIDADTITEEKLSTAIKSIVENDNYRQNVVRLRTLMRDQPQTPLERAVWWTEYVIRHSGARHLRAAGANLSWHQYYELEFFTYLVLGALSVTALFMLTLYYVYRLVLSKLFRTKIKVN